MSNPLAKKERSHAKDVRQGLVQQRERNHNARKHGPKPYTVHMRWRMLRHTLRHRFAKREDALAYRDKWQRTGWGGKVWVTDENGQVVE